jgi:hypothetical protein
MPETFLTPSSIKLFGRPMTGLTYANNTNPGPGNNNFLQEQLAGNDPKFARIYGFSFEGAYYALPRPALFLVHGDGLVVGNWDNTLPSTLDQSGVAGREWDFSGHAGAQDIYYWEYEKGDFSIRLETEAGTFEQILLMATLRAGADRADRSGMSVSGMSVSGMSVSGMSLSGMSLGANPNSPRNGR